MTAPLHGIRVVEHPSLTCPLPLRLAIAFTGRLAAGLGAVVEMAAAGSTGHAEALPHAQDAFLNLGKHAHRIDQAAPSPDIVLCDGGLPAGTPSGAVRCVFTLFPHTVPASDAQAASAFTIMAATGLLDLVGDPQREPLRMGGHQLAYACGLAAYGGIVAALCARQRGEAPDTVCVSLADVAVWLNWKSVAMASWAPAGRARLGRDAEWQVVRCADGWVALVFLEADWPVLRDFVNDPRLADPRYDVRAVRRTEAAHVASVMESAFLHHTRQQLKDMALARRLPLGPVWTPIELESDAHYRARGFLSRVDAGTGAPLLMPRLPVLWDGHAFPVMGAASCAGQAS